MSLTFSRNEEFTQQTMYINVIVPGGLSDRPNASAVESVQFTIYRGSSPNLITFSEYNLPAKPSERRGGAFYAPYHIPIDAPFGPYTLTWKINLVNEEVHFVDQSFYIEDVATLSLEAPSSVAILNGLNVSGRVMKLIKYVRMMLRDNNPDRNYHALPPRSARELQGYSNRVGFIWTDEEIHSYLKMALSDLNSNNPKTSRLFALENFPEMWLGVLVDITCIRALQALTINWIQDEFGYNISGLSLDLNKADKFSSLRSALEGGGLKERKDNATAIRPIGRSVSPARWNI